MAFWATASHSAHSIHLDLPKDTTVVARNELSSKSLKVLIQPLAHVPFHVYAWTMRVNLTATNHTHSQAHTQAHTGVRPLSHPALHLSAFTSLDSMRCSSMAYSNIIHPQRKQWSTTSVTNPSLGAQTRTCETVSSTSSLGGGLLGPLPNPTYLPP